MATVSMTRSGFCTWPSPGSHGFCRSREFSCTCLCHTDPAVAETLDAEAEACAAGYETSRQAESDDESGEGQGT